MKHLLIGMFAFFSPVLLFSQDIAGLWKGTMFNESTKESLEYEIIINKDNGKYSGYSHTWFLINDKKYYGIKKVKVRISKDGKVIIHDAALLKNNYPVAPYKNIRQLNVLTLSGIGNDIVLNGIFVTNQTKIYSELSGHVNVKKVSSFSSSYLLKYFEKDSDEKSLTSIK